MTAHPRPWTVSFTLPAGTTDPTRPIHSAAVVMAATRAALAELRALTPDPEVQQRWLAPRVRAKLQEMAS